MANNAGSTKKSTSTRNASSRLSHEAIAATALSMADREGIENVSMRKLASELGVTAMALYRYFDSIEDIRCAVVALAFTEVNADPIAGERWDDTIRRTTNSIREMYLRHANAHLYLVEGAGDSPALQAHTQRIYALHEAQGIPADILRKTWRILDAFLGGFMQGEIHELQLSQITERAGEEPVETWRKTARGAYSEETFHDGMDIIIAGVRAMAAPDACDWHTPSE